MTQPPGAPYQDGPYQDGPGWALAKPVSVGLAQRLMYAGGVISLLNGAMALFADEEALRQQAQETMEAQGQAVDPAIVDATVTGFMLGGPIFGVVFAGIWFLMAAMNGRGRGWARIVATILAAINVASVLYSFVGSSTMPGTGAGGTLTSALSLVSGALAAGIIVLLWRKESSVFFAAAPR